MKSKDKNQSILFHTALLLGLFMPTNNISYVVQGILPLILFVYYKPSRSFNIAKFVLFIILIIASSFIINSINVFSINTLFRFLSFIVLFGLFPFTKSIKISTTVLYISLFYIILSQVSYVLGINLLVNFFDSIYPYTGNQIGYQTDYLLRSAGDLESIVHRRYGGLYHNPNQCVKYVSFLLIIFLINAKGELKLYKKLIFLVSVLISIILSGSRTGFVVVLIVVLYDLFIYDVTRVNAKFFLSLIATLFLLIFLLLFFSDSDLRIFQVSEGNIDSLGAKFTFFYQYFQQVFSPLIFLFGNLSSENIYINYNLSQMDSEWGELFYSFGLLGIISFGMFYLKLWKTRYDKLRFYMFILLWGITSTIIFSYRMSFVFMLLLSSYYSDYVYARKESSHCRA